MEESNEDRNVSPGKSSASKSSWKVKMPYVWGRVMVAFPVSELYFLIAKFLSGGPLKETAKVNWMAIDVNIYYLKDHVVILNISVADFDKRARKRRGEYKLYYRV